MGLTDLRKIFDSASKSLKTPSEKHFKAIILIVLPQHNDTERIIEENAFGDVTFDKFYGNGINKINSNAFNKTADKLNEFKCDPCSLENQPPKYDIQSMLNQLIELTSLSIGLNVDLIPPNALQPIGGRESKMKNLVIAAKQNLTIETGAFQSFNKLTQLFFHLTAIKRIEKEAFKFNKKSESRLNLFFDNTKLTGKLIYNNSTK